MDSRWRVVYDTSGNRLFLQGMAEYLPDISSFDPIRCVCVSLNDKDAVGLNVERAKAGVCREPRRERAAWCFALQPCIHRVNYYITAYST